MAHSLGLQTVKNTQRLPCVNGTISYSKFFRLTHNLFSKLVGNHLFYLFLNLRTTTVGQNKICHCLAAVLSSNIASGGGEGGRPWFSMEHELGGDICSKHSLEGLGLNHEFRNFRGSLPAAVRGRKSRAGLPSTSRLYRVARMLYTPAKQKKSYC
jgi:hypothetical protein